MALIAASCWNICSAQPSIKAFRTCAVRKILRSTNSLPAKNIQFEFKFRSNMHTYSNSKFSPHTLTEKRLCNFANTCPLERLTTFSRVAVKLKTVSPLYARHI